MQRNTPILFIALGIVAVGLALGQSLASTADGVVEALDAPRPLAQVTSTQDPLSAQDPVQTPEQLALAAKVLELETKVATLEAWVAAQQAQAKVTAAALDQSEAEGFTAGINFESRHTLLRAWRAEAAKAQEGGMLPPQAVADPKKKGGEGNGSQPVPR